MDVPKKCCWLLLTKGVPTKHARQGNPQGLAKGWSRHAATGLISQVPYMSVWNVVTLTLTARNQTEPGLQVRTELALLISATFELWEKDGKAMPRSPRKAILAAPHRNENK